RNAVINAQLDHLGVYHYQPDLLRRGLVQQAQQQRVYAHALAAAGGAGYQHVRQLGYVADHALAGDVLAYGEGQRALGVLELRRLDDVAQVDQADYLVRRLDAGRAYLVRYRRYAHVHDAEGERDVVGEVRELGELHARVQLQVV